MFRLTRSRRLSRRSRSVSAVIGIAAVLWMIWIFLFRTTVAPEPTVIAPPEERLWLATLANDEEIVVIITGYRRPPMELRFRRDREATTVIVSSVVWSATDRAWKMARVLDFRPISAGEAAGLDAVVAHWRRPNQQTGLHAANYEIEHRRAESTVAREKLVECALAREWTDAKLFPGDEPDAKRDELDAAAQREGVPREEFEKWITFEMLIDRLADDDEPTGGTE